MLRAFLFQGEALMTAVGLKGAAAAPRASERLQVLRLTAGVHHLNLQLPCCQRPGRCLASLPAWLTSAGVLQHVQLELVALVSHLYAWNAVLSRESPSSMCPPVDSHALKTRVSRHEQQPAESARTLPAPVRTAVTCAAHAVLAC